MLLAVVSLLSLPMQKQPAGPLVVFDAPDMQRPKGKTINPSFIGSYAELFDAEHPFTIYRQKDQEGCYWFGGVWNCSTIDDYVVQMRDVVLAPLRKEFIHATRSHSLQAERERAAQIAGVSPRFQFVEPVHSPLCFYDATFLSTCLLYTSPSPRDRQKSRMPSSA